MKNLILVLGFIIMSLVASAQRVSTNSVVLLESADEITYESYHTFELKGAILVWTDNNNGDITYYFVENVDTAGEFTMINCNTMGKLATIYISFRESLVLFNGVLFFNKEGEIL